MDESTLETGTMNRETAPRTLVPGRLYRLIGEVLSFTAQVDQSIK